MPPHPGTHAFRRYSQGTRKCYKPTSTRLPFLFGVLIATLAFIALIEVAVRSYPVVNNPSGLWGFNLTRRALSNSGESEILQVDTLPVFENLDLRILKLSIVSTNSPPIKSYIQETTPSLSKASTTLAITSSLTLAPIVTTTTTIPDNTTNDQAFISTDSSTSHKTRLKFNITELGAYIPTESPSVTGVSGSTPTPLPDSGGEAGVDPAGHVVSSTLGIEQSIADAADIPSGTGQYTVPGATTQSAYILPTSGNIQNPKITSLVPLSTYTTDGYTVSVMGIPKTSSYVPISTYTSEYIMVVVGTQPPILSLVPVSTMSSGSTLVVVMGFQTSIPTHSGTLDSVVVKPVIATSGSSVYTYMTTVTIDSTKPVPTAAKATGTPAEFTNTCKPATSTPPQFTSMDYFTASYLPTLIAVAFRILWTSVYNNARLMEPFYRLASSSGASGKHCLELLYLSMDSFIPEPLPSLLAGHFYMFIVSSIALLAELVTPLCSELLAVDLNHGVIYGDGSDPNHPCWPQLVARNLPARILQGLLALAALMIILTMILSWNRPSGVYSNPSSIAVMASLLHHPDVVDGFKALGNNPNFEEVMRITSEQTYKLAQYQAGSDGVKYGIVPVLQTTKAENRMSNAHPSVEDPESGVRTRAYGLQGRRRFWRRTGDVIVGFLMVGVLAVVAAYYKDRNSDGFNRFFNSQSFGPRFILVFTGGVIVSQWKRIEREVRTLQSYRRLNSRASSSPTHTILRPTTATPWTTFPLALVQREFFTATVSSCYLLSEVLVIVLATVPFSASEYWMAYLAGTYISLSILGFQILTFIALIAWWRRTGPRLDRDPDTLLGVWTLLAQSGIRQDFENLGRATRKEVVSSVKSWKKRYWMGEVVEKDDVMRMVINAEDVNNIVTNGDKRG